MTELLSPPRSIPAAEILAIAEADARVAYRDLSMFRIEIVQQEDGWHVGYFIKTPLVAGGGPHYVISAETGEILSKKYYQ